MSKRSFADIKALKKPNEISVELILNPELTRVLTELQRRHTQADRMDKKENRTKEAPALAKEIDALIDEIEDNKVEFSFKDPGREAFDELVDACPPTDEDIKTGKESGEATPSWGPTKFVPGLLALTSFNPELTFDDAVEIYNDWGRGDVEVLFNTALQACLEQASIPFTRKDTDAILASVQNLITQQDTESPTDST